MLTAEEKSRLPLFEAFPRLAERVAWVRLGEWPTPVGTAPNFSRRHGISSLHFKREDLSHRECGGNKVRGLEFLLGKATRDGAKTILSFSSVGSHHLSKTAWHARRFGINTVALVVPQENARYVRRNLAAGLAAGARYVPANYLTVLPKLATEAMRLKLGREHMLIVPPGGTTPLSCLGHVNAAMELKRQINAGILPEPDFVYVPMGSLGTAAGLALGFALAELSTRVVGVAVSYRWYCTPRRCAKFARQTLGLMRAMDPSVPDVDFGKDRIAVVGDALGSRYARFTPQAVQLARELYDCDGLALDGTYTSKALHGMLLWIERNNLSQTTRHLFWHTFAPSPLTTLDVRLVEQLPSSLRKYFTEEPQELDGQLPGGE